MTVAHVLSRQAAAGDKGPSGLSGLTGNSGLSGTSGLSGITGVSTRIGVLGASDNVSLPLSLRGCLDCRCE